MDKRMKKTFDMKTVVGYGFSPAVQEKIDNGYIALVEIDDEKSNYSSAKNTLKIEEAYGTGRIAYLKENVAKDMLGISGESKMIYIDIKIFEHLNKSNDKLEKDGVEKKAKK
jgi:hypothetical protein